MNLRSNFHIFSTLHRTISIRKFEANQDFKLNGTHKLMVYADVNMLSGGTHTKIKT